MFDPTRWSRSEPIMRTLAALSIALCTFVAGAADAQPVGFERVADASTPGVALPEPVGFSVPASDAGRVAFHAIQTLLPRQGAFLAHAGTVSVVADDTTVIPGGGGTFGSFYESPAVSGDDVAFTASDANGDLGVYARLGGSLVKVADATTTEPGGGSTLTIDSRGPALDAGNLVFRAFDSGGWPGAYAFIGGTLVTAADENTALPGGAGNPFVTLARPAIDGAAVAFRATDASTAGLFVVTGGSVRAVFDGSAPLPGSAFTGGFVEGNPSFRAGSVAFVAGSLDRTGVYAEVEGLLDVVADDTTPIPGSADTFAWFGGPDTGRVAVDGATVAFIAGPATGPIGLYVRHAGVLQSVLTTDDTLDGEGITLLEIGPDAVDANRIAFLVTFDDFTQAIYVATLATPVPATSLPARFALGLLLGIVCIARVSRANRPASREPRSA